MERRDGKAESAKDLCRSTPRSRLQIDQIAQDMDASMDKVCHRGVFPVQLHRRQEVVAVYAVGVALLLVLSLAFVIVQFGLRASIMPGQLVGEIEETGGWRLQHFAAERSAQGADRLRSRRRRGWWRSGSASTITSI